MIDRNAKELQSGAHAALSNAVGGVLESFAGAPKICGQKSELSCLAFKT